MQVYSHYVGQNRDKEVCNVKKQHECAAEQSSLTNNKRVSWTHDVIS